MRELVPLGSGDDPAEWLHRAHAYGVPAVVPCFLEGAPVLASGAIVWEDSGLMRRARTSPHQERVALEACRRMYGIARDLGADILIP